MNKKIEPIAVSFLIFALLTMAVISAGDRSSHPLYETKMTGVITKVEEKCGRGCSYFYTFQDGTEVKSAGKPLQILKNNKIVDIQKGDTVSVTHRWGKYTLGGTFTESFVVEVK